MEEEAKPTAKSKRKPKPKLLSPEDSWELEALKFYRSENNLEFELLNQRVNGFLAAQAFLLGAFAVAVGFQLDPINNWFVHILVGFGVGISILIRFGIVGACKTIDMWFLKQRHLLADMTKIDDKNWKKFLSKRDENWMEKRNEFHTPEIYSTLIVDTTHRRSYWFPKGLPFITGLMWIVLWLLFYFFPLKKS